MIQKCIHKTLIQVKVPKKGFKWKWVKCNQKATFVGYCKKHAIIKELKSD